MYVVLIMNTFLSLHKIVISESVAAQIISSLLSDIVSQIKKVIFKPGFEYC